jgi:hypothetical protein
LADTGQNLSDVGHYFVQSGQWEELNPALTDLSEHLAGHLSASQKFDVAAVPFVPQLRLTGGPYEFWMD